MRLPTRWSLVFLLLVAVFGPGCSKVASPSDRTTDTKNGILRVGQTAVETFTISKRGELEVRLTALTPPFANPIGLQLGQNVSAGCVPFGQPIGVLVGNNIPYGLLDPGNYCVVLSASSAMTVDENYTITITHS
jgi:hypothetical protein